MAYTRRQQLGKTDSPYSHNYDFAPPPDGNRPASSPYSLATKAIRASAAYRDSSLSSAYEQSALSSPRESLYSYDKDSSLHESAPKKSINESRKGFWGALARKTKAILDDDNEAQQPEMPKRTVLQTSERASSGQLHNTYSSSESHQKTESSSLQKGLGAIVSSLSQIGGTIGNALEEGITAVENRTSEIIQETCKIQVKKKSGSTVSQNQASNLGSLRQQPMMQTPVQPQSQTPTDLEMQLKASRDVAMAMAAKAKLLLRELKTAKADLAFAKERCGQLEEENRVLRENREKGDNLEDDDLVRLQLETLLAEKARLAQENSVYARENRFLREIVEYHQLTMQDVVYLDERSEEVTEVCPIKTTTTTKTAANLQSNVTVPTIPKGAISQNNQNVPPVLTDASEIVNPYIQMPGEDLR